jgi:hypothetical protein
MKVAAFGEMGVTVHQLHDISSKKNHNFINKINYQIQNLTTLTGKQFIL